MKRLKLYFSVLLTLCCSLSLYAQRDGGTISLSFDNIPLQEAIAKIEAVSDYHFFYDEGIIDLKQRVSLKCTNLAVATAVEKMLSPIGQRFIVEGRQIALLPQDQAAPSRRNISGRVVDKSGVPVIGATVIVATDATAGTVTNPDGGFNLTVPNAQVELQINCMGYLPQTATLPTTSSTLTVTLVEDTFEVDDIVVVGYGTQKKVNLTGAIAMVDSDQLADRNTATVGEMLQGVVPGLNIARTSGQPGESASINIRGVTSINGGDPLILIDGAEGDLSTLNPNDVESISVVKDASSAAIYGARAAFGVILVTTKIGDAEQKAKISYNGRVGWTSPAASTDYESRGYYSVYINDLFHKAATGSNYTLYTKEDYDELWARRYDEVENPDRPWVVMSNRDGKSEYLYYGNTDWYHYLYQDTRPTTNHSVSVSGGDKKLQYLLSGNYYSEEGMLAHNTDVTQNYNLRAKMSFKVSDKLKITSNTSYYSYRYDYPNASPVGSSMWLPTNHGLASYVPRNPDGSSVHITSICSTGAGVMDGLLPILDNDNFKNLDLSDKLSTTMEAVYSPIKGLDIVGNFTYIYQSSRSTNRSVNTQYSKYPGEIITETTGNKVDKLRENNSNSKYRQTNIYATYTTTINDDHNFKVMGGYNYEDKSYKKVLATGYDLLSETLNDLSLVGQGENGEARMEVSGGQSEHAIMGFFGRFNYDYQGKYLFEASGRYDGTSRFASDSRWAFFPSFSGAWRVSEESFFEPLRDDIDNLKVRYSYGRLGNQNVGNYDSFQTISVSTQSYIFESGSKPTTANLSAPVASNLTWETAVHNNLGVDMSLLGNRLNFSTDLYIRDTKDMLTDGIALPSTYGDSSPQMNVADLRTKGYELSLGWRDSFKVGSNPFQYSVNLTFSDYTTVITKFDNPDRIFAKKYYEGMQWGEIWGYHVDGYFKSDEEAANYYVDQTLVNSRINSAVGSEKGLKAGDLKYIDLDGDHVISTGSGTVDDPGDKYIIGNSQPRYNYGATFSASWCGIDFSMFFQGVGKQSWYPGSNCLSFWGPYCRPYATFIPEGFHNMYWTEENPDAYFPRPRGYIALDNKGDKSLGTTNDRYLQDIGYCRLKNLTIGYTLPKDWTTKLNLEKVRFYFSGENMLTWTSLVADNIDPELAAASAVGTVDGDLRDYPISKSSTFGVNVVF